MKKENKKITNLTSEDLEQQTQIILEAIDHRFIKNDKRFDGIDQRFDKVEGRIERTRIELKQDLESTKKELKADINNVQTLIDGYVKAQEDFREEFVIMNPAPFPINS